MQIILLKDIEKLGNRFDVVKVKPGYGRNYLIPQGFAQIASASNMSRLEEFKSKELELENQKIAEFEAIRAKLESQSINIGAKAGTSGKIFGSVTNVQLATAVKDAFNLDIERKKIEVPEEVKEIGSYIAEVHLYKNIIAKLRFEVVAE